MSRRHVTAVAATLAMLLPTAACGTQDERATITVLAAASLTSSFTELADAFEAAHPGVRVRLAFNSSATLAQQAVDGAPADVLATADSATMRSAEAALADEPRLFASNTMVLVTPADNPADLTSFEGLDSAAVSYVTCVPTAPCGAAADALLTGSGIAAPPVSREIDVKAVLARVTEGEADAGIVYATDARAAGTAVTTLEIPGAATRLTTYPIATLEQSTHPDLARAFVELVTSATGQRTLRSAGFGPP